jgi:TonB family protein
MAFAISAVQFDPLPYRRLAAAIGVSVGLHLLLALTVGPLSPASTAAPAVDVMTVTIAPDPAGRPTPAAEQAAAPATVAHTDAETAPRSTAHDQSPEPGARVALAPAPALPYYYLSSEVDAPAQVINDVLLRYPPNAFERGIGGEVLLRIYINEAGTIDDIEIRDAVPKGLFEDAALEAAWQLLYSPALKDGRAVKNVRTIGIVFDPSDAPL